MCTDDIYFELIIAILFPIFTTQKKSRGVWGVGVGVGVCVGVCSYAFRYASRYAAETCNGGIGDGPTRLKSIFSK